MSVTFGIAELPEKQAQSLRRAIRLEWITIAFLAVTVTLVFLVLGNSQAMRAAWIEDLLSFIPPIAFLIAVRVNRWRPTRAHPYGYHRSIGVGHLVSAVALTTMGTFLIITSAAGLVRLEHPTIGTVELFGQSIWLGWLMIGVMAATALPPVFIGRIKMALAKDLHNKVLYADADMNKADWMTAIGTIVGVSGIGLGIWWLDGAAALFIAGSILWDGVRNLKAAILDLMDERATTFDERRPHPVAAEIEGYLRSLPWVAEAGCRVRDQGHVFHVEAFVVPRRRRMPKVAELERAREACIRVDWKAADVVIVPVPVLPAVVRDDAETGSR
ncbi:cation diffusion facilitator family transporter [Salinibacterium sp. ZJ70]|uniref:cation diffusion facilitator family transporter n=1 Tax=Salinibacterium sp. ZJ70 TaxID=2708084 RepID=UPI00141F30F6|nr:cation diffusion facilitator family transporter [Salinibacterium sp. ZJ70]